MCADFSVPSPTDFHGYAALSLAPNHTPLHGTAVFDCPKKPHHHSPCSGRTHPHCRTAASLHFIDTPHLQAIPRGPRSARLAWSRSRSGALPCDESNVLYCSQIARRSPALDVWPPLQPRCSTHRISNRQPDVADTVPSVLISPTLHWCTTD
jgi:hypothetical protein